LDANAKIADKMEENPHGVDKQQSHWREDSSVEQSDAKSVKVIHHKLVIRIEDDCLKNIL